MTIKDPNLRFPKTFALSADLDVFEMPDGLGFQMRGGATNLVVRGRLAVQLMPWLLEKLREKSTLESIVSERPANSNAGEIEELLLLLLRKGYLVAADGAKSVDTAETSNAAGTADKTGAIIAAGNGNAANRAKNSVDVKQRLFWGRKLGFTRNNSSAEEVDRKLAEAKVILVADGLLGCCTFDVLARSGVNSIDVVDRLNDEDLKELVAIEREGHLLTSYTQAQTLDALAEIIETKAQTADLLLTVTRNAPLSFFKLMNSIALQTPIEWLRANETSVELEIGPLLVPYDTACYSCLELRVRSADDYPIEESLYMRHLESDQKNETLPLKGECLAFATAGGAQIAMEAIRAVTNISLPVTLGAVIFNTFDGHSETMQVPKVARCPDCYRGTVEVRGETQSRRDSAYA